MRRFVSIFGVAFLVASSCGRMDFEAPVSVPDGRDPSVMDASCTMDNVNDEDDRGIAVKSVIGQTTITALDGNFIKMDETRHEDWMSADYRPSAFTEWADYETKILEASVMSSPDNTENIHFRSVMFKPRQTYQMSITDEDGDYTTKDDQDIVGYISRMVGWYPKTFDVPLGPDGTPADTKFTETDSYVRIEKDGTEYDCVRFKGKLDGQTDVMVTDMREGRYDLSHKGFKNNASDYDVQPYGHYFNNNLDPTDGYQYCNYFTFKHYLTAIRLFVIVEESDLSLISWRHINDVVFRDQPSTVSIALPKEQSRGAGVSPIVDGATPTLPVEGVEPVFGEALEWADFNNMRIAKTAMAENDPDHPEFADTPSYPIEMRHAVNMDRTYLGYMLVRPDMETEIEIHTDAGVFSAVIPVRASYLDEATGSMVEEDILKAGNIYNIVIDIRTDGSLDVIVGNEDFRQFRNLAPYNKNIADFEYSNCYVITPEIMKKSENEYYDGYYFQAMEPGCGARGMITGTAADLYPDADMFDPQSVRILWQDTQYLITNVDLVHGHIRFSLNDKCREEGLCGNAVLAAYDEDENIIWTWHIWVTDQLQDVTYGLLKYNDYENIPNFGNFDDPNLRPEAKSLTDVTFMNMNLGATKATWTGASDALETYGLYYQWGRKDPFPGPSTSDYAQADLSTKTYYYMDEGAKNSVSEYLPLYPIVEDGARHPLEIVGTAQVSETYPNDWLYSSVDQLWGYSPSAKRIVKKTIYDPCPYGYRVADDELYALFYYCQNGYSGKTLSATEERGYGIKISSGSGTDAATGENWFPYTGWRGHDRGRTDKTHAWFNVGRLGDYQDARVCKNSTTYMNHRGRAFLITSSEISDGYFEIRDVKPAYTKQLTTDYANRASASPVRCVRYDGPAEEPAGM